MITASRTSFSKEPNMTISAQALLLGFLLIRWAFFNRGGHRMWKSNAQQQHSNAATKDLLERWKRLPFSRWSFPKTFGRLTAPPEVQYEFRKNTSYRKFIPVVVVRCSRALFEIACRSILKLIRELIWKLIFQTSTCDYAEMVGDHGLCNIFADYI